MPEHLTVSTVSLIVLFMLISIALGFYILFFPFLSYATIPPNSPQQLTPSHNASWSDTEAIPPGNITFTWKDNGDPEGTPLWFYFYLIKWNSSTKKWDVHTTTYTSAQGETTITKNLSAGFYAWQVAAVDATQSSEPWHAWADLNQDGQVTSADWSFVVVKTTTTGGGGGGGNVVIMEHIGGSGSISTAQYKANRSYMESATPFRGVLLEAHKNGGGPKLDLQVNRFVPLNKADYSDAVNDVKTAGWTTGSPRFWNSNFLSTFFNTVPTGKTCGGGNEPFNFFASPANLQIVYDNWRKVGELAREMGPSVRGVSIDAEQSYQNQHWAEYDVQEACHSDCGGTGCKDPVTGASCGSNAACRRAAWAKQVRLVGKNIMENLVAGYGPNFHNFYRQGFTYTRKQEECGNGRSLAVPGSNRGEFIPALMNGFMDAMRTSANPDMESAALIDWAYAAGGWTRNVPNNGVPSGSLSDDVWDGLWNIYKPVDSSCVANTGCNDVTPSNAAGTQHCGYAITHPYSVATGVGYVDPVNKSVYKNPSKMKFGFFFHESGADNDSWFNAAGTGNKSNCNLSNPTYDCNNYTPDQIKTWIQKAMNPKYGISTILMWTNTIGFNNQHPRWMLPGGINRHYLDKLNEL